MSKITKATFKAFLRKNAPVLLKVGSTFDPMVDGVRPVGGGFEVARKSEYVSEHNQGLAGVWIVQGPRNYFSEYIKDGLVGIRVSNCCGSFVVAAPAAKAVLNWV
jgi:hypothetical protein